MIRHNHQYRRPCDCMDCLPDPTDGLVVPGFCNRCGANLVCWRRGGRLTWEDPNTHRPHTCTEPAAPYGHA